MNTRDICLAVVTICAIAVGGWLIHDGSDPQAVTAIIALGGVALGRISGANSTAEPAVIEAVGNAASEVKQTPDGDPYGYAAMGAVPLGFDTDHGERDVP
jgi:hypothetical protein